MADIARKMSNLKKNMLLSLLKAALFFLAGISFLALAIYIYVFTGETSLYYLFLGVPFLIFLAVARKYMTNFLTFRQGYKGEQQVIKCLKKLPDSYRVYTSVILKSHYGKKETDQIIVGKQGVFIVETKNYRGTVKGKGGIEPWYLIKTSKAGKDYSNRLSSPVRQLRDQLKMLQSMLYNAGISVEVKGMVVFGKETLVMAEGLSVPLVSLNNGCSGLLEEIENSRAGIDDKTLKKIHELLDNLS